jgi:hypothetical protein
MPESATSMPSEEYIAGRERGRAAGLKHTRKVRFRRIVAGAIFGGAFTGIMIASPATTGLTTFSFPTALTIFAIFVALGCLALWRAQYSYRRSMSRLRDDIIRSVVSPDDVEREPGRLRKWWLRADSSGDNPWELSVRDGANDWHRKY